MEVKPATTRKAKKEAELSLSSSLHANESNNGESKSKLLKIHTSPTPQVNASGQHSKTSIDIDGDETCSEPVGKSTNGFGLFCSVNLEHGFWMYDPKTPPLEASLSPDIQRRPGSRIPVIEPEATPVFYGAGHLVSGFTDRRKCRVRGSLRGGFEKGDLSFDDDDSPVSLPGEASVRWLDEVADEKTAAHSCLSPSNCLSGGNVIQTPITDSSSGSPCTSLDSLALSQVRISWRSDEFDGCCLLSDEEADGSVSDDDLMIARLLDYEPRISGRGKGEPSSDRRNTCAESICTDGGGLVASNDSDWSILLLFCS